MTAVMLLRLFGAVKSVFYIFQPFLMEFNFRYFLYIVFTFTTPKLLCGFMIASRGVIAMILLRLVLVRAAPSLA